MIVARNGAVDDDELERLLTRVYVDGGFTDAALAPSMFAPAAVRARGTLITARDDGALLGMVLVVPPTSPSRRLAQPDEAELHLLAVADEARGRGVGRTLVDEALRVARDDGRARVILWTQPSMHAAQRLYVRAGFARDPTRDFQRGDRAFMVFARDADA